MATSKTPKKATSPTPALSWKGKQGSLVTLPSGNTARVKTPGMQAFIQAGVIPDTLTPLVRKMMAGKSVDTEGLLNDEKALQELFALYDTVVIHCMVDPMVLPLPEAKSLRKADRLYVDEVAFEDKTFLFQLAVGGTADLERFRSQQEEAVASVLARAPVEGQTVRTAGDH